jgi:hypothetical protein
VPLLYILTFFEGTINIQRVGALETGQPDDADKTMVQEHFL